MICVLTSMAYAPELLPQFADHYYQLEVDEIHCLVHGPKADEVLERAQALVSAKSITFHQTNARWRNSPIEAINKDELRLKLRLNQSDWYIPADLDEFVSFYPVEKALAVEALTAVMTERNYQYSSGKFIDKVSATGELTVFDPKQSLQSQYPQTTHITRDIMKLDDKKVVLCRGSRAVSSGHHRIVDGTLKEWPELFTIDHYAWRSTRLTMLDQRYANYPPGVLHEPLERLKTHLNSNQGRLCTNR